MLVSQLVSLTYRMERISEEEQSIHIDSIGGDLGCYSSAHGFSAYEDSGRLVFAVLCLVDDCPVAFFEDLSPVRHSSACFHVWKVEFDSQEASLCEFCMEVSYEGRVHWPAGTVGYNETCGGIMYLGRDAVDDTGLAASGQFDLSLIDSVRFTGVLRGLPVPSVLIRVRARDLA